MGFLDGFSFSYDPYSGGDYESGVGGNNGFFSFRPPNNGFQAQDNWNPSSRAGDNFISRFRSLPANNDLIDYYDRGGLNKYQDLAASAPESEKLLRDYAESMPEKSKFHNSVWDYIGAGLMGLSTGLSNFDKPNPAATYAATKGVMDQPYNDAMADWKNRGSKITTEARLLDAARNRELGSLKFGLDKDASERRFQALDSSKVLDRNVRLNEGAARADASDAALEERKRESNARERRYNDEFAAREDRLRQEFADREVRLGNQDHTAKAPYRSPEQQSETQQKMLERAHADVMNNEIFKQFFAPAKDAMGNDVFKFIGTPEQKAAIDRFIQARLQIYRMGGY